jgi:vacuolar-type H+-ATPase subunit H
VREVIEEILGKEKDGLRVVDEARAQAAEMKAKVEAEAEALLAAAREQSQTLLREETTRARKEAQTAHEAAVKQAEEENARFLERQAGKLQHLVDEVVRLITTPEHAKH